jgi:hypothetical protein
MQFWLEDYFSLPNNVMDDTFKILSDLTVIEMGRETMHSEATINKWKKDGDIINFDNLTYRDFIVPFTGPVAAGPVAASPVAAGPVPKGECVSSPVDKPGPILHAVYVLF